MAPSAAAVLCAVTFLSLSAPWSLLPSSALVRAQDAEEDDAASGEEVDAASPEGAKTLSDSAKEVQDKLGQLKTLLNNRGDAADPKLKEQLEALEKQLKGLDMGSLDQASQSTPGDGGLSKLLGACAVMSVKRAGQQRPSTMAGLRRLGDTSLSKKDAADSDVARMSVACINELTGDQLDQYTAGALQMLPKEISNKAQAPEAMEQVEQMEDDMWKTLQQTGKALFDQYQEQRGQGEDLGTSNYLGLLLLVPVAGIAIYIGKKFYDMQQDKETKKSSGKKKKAN